MVRDFLICLRLKKNCSKLLPNKNRFFCAMNSARKRMLSWRSYSHCRNKTEKQSFYIMAAISVINVCMYNQWTPLFPNNNSLPAVSWVYLFLGLRKVQNRTSSTDRVVGNKYHLHCMVRKQLLLLKKELLPNAYLIDCNTMKYVFRRRAVQ